MTDSIATLEALLGQPETRQWLLLTAAGVLGAIVSLALDAKAFVLPSIRQHRVELGSLGPVLACVVTAHFVDHDFQTALLGSLCGVSALRHIRARIRATFEHEINGLSAGERQDGPHE